VDLLLDQLAAGDGEPAKVLIVDWSQVTGVDTKGALECSRLLWPQGPRLIWCGASDAVLEGLSHAGLRPHARGPPIDVASDIEMVDLVNHAGTSPHGDRDQAVGQREEVPTNLPLARTRLMSLSFRVSQSRSDLCPQCLAVRDLEEAVALARTMVQALPPISEISADDNKD